MSQKKTLEIVPSVLDSLPPVGTTKQESPADLYSPDPNDSVDALAESIGEFGQLTPVRIDSSGVIISGKRIIRAAMQHPTNVLTLHLPYDGIKAQMAGVEADMVRTPQTVLQRAETLLHWKHLYETMHPETKNGGNPKKKLQNEIPSFSDYAACRTQMHKRSIEQLVQIAQGIPEKARKLFHHVHKVRDSLKDLLLFARTEDKEIVNAAAEVLLEKPTQKLNAFHALRLAKRKKMADEFEKNPTPLPHLIHGDFRIVLKEFSDNHFDAVITDPLWGQQGLHLLPDLAEQSARIVKPGGIVAVMFGQIHIPAAFEAFSKHLNWHWLDCDYQGKESESPVAERNTYSHWKPILIYCKGDYNRPWCSDFIDSRGKKDKLWHDYGQSVLVFEELVRRFTNPGDLIIDPCCGGGTTLVAALKLKRKCIGIDIDENAIKISTIRLNQPDGTEQKVLPTAKPATLAEVTL